MTTRSFTKVGECLYRDPTRGIIYAVVKLKGKQHKRSLRTKSLPEARRKLMDYRRELEQVRAHD
jgi:phage-related minor tail protein